MNQDRRKHKRFPVLENIAKSIELFIPEKSSYGLPAILLDLSRSGVGLLTFTPIKVGTILNIDIDLIELHIHNLKGKVVWMKNIQQTYRIGVKFLEIEEKIAKKIDKIAQDYTDCEIKLSLGVKDVCFKKCNYYTLCNKKYKLP